MMLHRTLAKLVVITIFVATASCADRSDTLNNNYVFSTGAVVPSDDDPITNGYYVTTVHRPSEAPWLLVAKPLTIGWKDGFETESSPASKVVTIDGREYIPKPEQCIVALQTDRGYTRQVVPVSENSTLQRMSNVSLAIEFDRLDGLLTLPDEAEQRDAPESSN